MKIEELQSGILITNFAAASDGGSLYFECETTENSKFNLLFTQHAFLDNPDPEMLPGRIYLNQEIIDLKSKEEKMILLGLKDFNVSNELLNMKSELANTINELRSFYSSGLSIEIKKKVDNKT